MKNRVCCLYRASTVKQVSFDERLNADIPTQRKECHRFADLHGWTTVMEALEEGVSGHKIRVANRDKIQLIKEAAVQKKFDILLVFMFDRIGRIADEPPVGEFQKMQSIQSGQFLSIQKNTSCRNWPES